MMARTVLILALLVGLDVGQTRSASAEPASLVTEMFQGVNRARLEAGLPPLAEDTGLDALALERSFDMLSRHYFSHTSPDGLTVFNLMQERGVTYQFAGENLAWNTYKERDTARVALQGFLSSAGHRANMLNANFSQVGVGVAADGGNTYYTLVFVG